ncbi:MAG TPA: glycosyltransferase family 87 protein [Candidatus Dormibacteraeota bacterium]|nr:glycosyltransferase family 87 protein [Candidatus Dormibacteraeota bacterium]
MRKALFALLAAVAFALVVIVLAAYGWPASRFLHGDYIQYWLASRSLLEGWDPYDAKVWRAMHDAIGSAGYEIAPGFGFLYPLTTATAALPFALLPVAFAAPLWFVTQSSALLVALVALGRRIFATHPRRDVVLLLLLAIVMEPAYVLAGDGNLSRFLPAIVGGALALLLRGRTISAGLVLGLGVLKPHLLIVFVPALLLFLSWRERIRVVFGAAVTIGGLLVASYQLRPGWLNEWIGVVTTVQGAYGRTNLWGYVPPEQRMVGYGIAAALVLALLLWWYVRRPPILVAASVALALSLFLSPYGGPLDQALLLVAVATYLAMIEDVSGIRRAILVLLLIGTSTALAWPSWIGVRDPGFEVEIPAPAIALLLVLLDFVVRAPVRRPRTVPAGAG